MNTNDELLSYVLSTFSADQRAEICASEVKYLGQEALVELTVREETPVLMAHAAALEQEFDALGKTVRVSLRTAAAA